MNKQSQRISAADLKRCERAMTAVRHMAGLKQCKRYMTAGLAAAELLERLGRLKLIYAAMVGTVLGPGIIGLPPRAWALGAVGITNQLYGFAYPAPKAADWRGEILKPFTLLIERIDWLEKQRESE